MLDKNATCNCENFEHNIEKKQEQQGQPDDSVEMRHMRQ